MDNNKYGLYKRIMKHDPKAIDEISSLEEAKDLIKMITGNVYLNSEAYQIEQEMMDKLLSGDKKVVDKLIEQFTSHRTKEDIADID